MKIWLGGISLVLVLAGCEAETPPGGSNDFLDSGASGGTSGTTTAGTTATTGGTTTAGTVGGDTTGTAGGTTAGTTGGTTDTTAGTTGGTTDTSGGTTDTTAGTTGGETTGGTTDTTAGTTGGETTGGDSGGTTAPVENLVAGTWEGCSSYGPEMNGMCAGYYCNVTAEQISASRMPSDKPCAHIEGMDICGGALTTVTGECARQEKTLNPLASDDDLEPLVMQCVLNHADIDTSIVTMECAQCFVNAARCASEHCLLQCLIGDSPECDSCRIQNNCNQPVPDCGGLPSPF